MVMIGEHRVVGNKFLQLLALEYEFITDVILCSYLT